MNTTRICNKCGKGESEGAKFWNRKSGKNRCIECEQKRMRIWYVALKLEVFTHYSNGSLKCACPGCTENRIPFLTLDHIDGGGNKHRASLCGPKNKSKQPGPRGVLLSLKKLGFPPGYRILCYNCNIAKGAGKCPVHEAGDAEIGLG